MPGIMEFPQIVQEAVEKFTDLFANEPQRRHFAEYLTGLFVAKRKTVLGIHSEFANISDQSCLNRFLTEVDWDVDKVNARRLQWLQEDPETRYSRDGVIPIDNVLIDHDGKHIEDAGWFWDHAEQRNKIAHDYIIANYVCPSGKHYPLNFRRFIKRDACTERGLPFRDHTQMVCDLIDWTHEQGIPGVFTWDSYFSNNDIMNHTHGKTDASGQPRGYVGDVKFNRKVEWHGKEWRIDKMAATILASDRKELRRGDKRQWYFSVCLHIPGVKHKVRVVMIWDRRHDTQPKKILVTNRVYWEATRIIQVYRQRWTGTETFHRDGKQQLGMGDCQLRDGQGQTRHMHLVVLAYSLLVRQLKHGRSREWALCKLTTIGEACRAMLREALRTTIAWVFDKAQKNEETYEHVITQLNLA
jgi:hypothetical protein